MGPVGVCLYVGPVGVYLYVGPVGVCLYVGPVGVCLYVDPVVYSLLFHAFFISPSHHAQVSAWGGYVFIINLIPLHVFALILMGRFSHR